MTNIRKSLLFVRDYTGQDNDRFFLWFENQLVETTALLLVEEQVEIACHDFWLIAPSIFNQTNKLPELVTDIEELRISTSGTRADRENKEQSDISKLLNKFADQDIIDTYFSIFYKKLPIDYGILSAVGEALLHCSLKIESDAKDRLEWDRYIQIERPVTDYLIKSTATGILINSDKLRKHKNEIDFTYYMALKEFSANYNMPLEVPNDAEIVNYLEPLGFDFSGVNVDYVLKFVPMQDNFAVDLLTLRKIANSRKVLYAIPLSQNKIFPIVDSFGSMTSRIYFKDPSLQNLAKIHRDILIPDENKVFSYIDYEQYEAGIMAALSDDKILLKLYLEGDLYEQAAHDVFNDRSKRKFAKRLFLSYAYGMKKKSLIDAAFAYGADRKAAKAFFNQFSEFEAWKNTIYMTFETEGRIGTALGNYLRRERTGALTDKEKRSAVSQTIQGTASLIFKKALLALRQETHIELKLPLHDAVLFQHHRSFDTNIVTRIFSDAMSDHFGRKIVGKASIAEFFAASP